MEVLIPLVIVAAFFAFTAKARAAEEERLNSVWQSIADEFDGRFVSEELGWFGETTRELFVEVDGVNCHVDTFTRGSGKEKRTFTRIRARANAPSDMTLKVSREHVFSGVARALGFQDIIVGDDAFDDEFVIKSPDPVFTRCWLNKTVRNRIYESDYEFQLKSGRVIAEMQGLDSDPASLEAAMMALAAFSDGKHRVVSIFNKVARKFGGEVKKKRQGWAVLTAEVDGMRVTIDTFENGKSHYCTVSARVVGPKLTPLALTVDQHEFSPNLPFVEMADLPEGYYAWTYERDRAAGHVTEEVKKQIEALEPVKVRLDEEQVRVFLKGICPPSRDLIAAVKLATTLAAGAARGPYR